MLIFWLAAGALAAGVLLGGLSAIAARRRHSADDILADAIDAELPQLQCAECGYPGCRPFALAVARGEAGIGLCLPGGEDVVRRLAEIVNEPPPPQQQKPAGGKIAASITATSANGEWIPACAGMTGDVAGVTKDVAGVTGDVAGVTKGVAGVTEDAAANKTTYSANGKWIPACAGMTGEVAGVTEDVAGVMKSLAGVTENANHSGARVAFIHREECVGCALCLPVCPTDAIVGAARFEHSVLEKDCTGCALCLPVCPTDAIEMRRPKRRTALNQTLAGFRAATPPPKAAGQPCIRCNLCADVCPAGLSPMRLYALSKDEEWKKMTAEGLAQCIHCKQCDDICPSAIPLSAAFARGKKTAAKSARAKTESARLKTRFDMRQKRQIPPPPPAIDAKAQAAAAQARLRK